MGSLLLAVIYLVFISLGLPDSLLGSGWPKMQAVFGVPSSYAGYVSMTISFMTIISALLSPRMIRKYHTKWIVIVSIALTVFGLLGFSVCGRYPMLFLFAIPYGLGAGSIDASVNHYVASHYSSSVMNFLHCFYGVGAVISPYIMSLALKLARWNEGYRWTSYIQLGILWIVCLAYFVFLNAKKLRYTIPAFFIGVLASLGISLALSSLGYITHAFWIPFGLFVLFIFSLGGHYIRAALERQNVTKTFERYVAPNVVSEILKEGTDSLKLGGKTVDIAVLFVDIRGFTTMSERLSPEEVVFILNQYLSMTSACVDRYHGTLDKFIGDATMAFWGAPIADDDAVYHACMAALDIVKGADELSAKLKAEINEEIHVGVGVNFGPAVVGNMGSERRMDYTAIGDTVNTSARLEANAPGGMVYVSRSVIDRLNGRMKYEPLEKPIKLKGKADGFEILRLLGPEE